MATSIAAPSARIASTHPRASRHAVQGRSFTKYLGLAYDERVMIDGKPFLRHLQDRLHRPQTRALLSKLSARFPAAVVMLDLASEQIAGATMAEVSTVLYYYTSPAGKCRRTAARF